MSKISSKFDELRSKDEKALIAYIMVGYPSEKDTISIVKNMIKGGVDIIELGFPFSDPIADGPIIQNASTVSLKNKTSFSKFLKIVKAIRRESDIPLILMTYANILYKKGFDNYLSSIKKAGIDGIILPDMPLEESDNYLTIAKKNNIDTIFLVSPNTEDSRIKKISNASSGFLYLVAVYGTTGIKTEIKNYTIQALKKIKKITKNNIPIGIGFGINSPDDVKKYVKAGADAVIVGSAFLKLIEKTPKNNIQKKILKFTNELKKATKVR